MWCESVMSLEIHIQSVCVSYERHNGMEESKSYLMGSTKFEQETEISFP